MRLYSFVPQDCSGKVRWLLFEMGQSFEEVKLNYREGDTKTEEYLTKHPLGQVPVLEDGDLKIFESHAIVCYLADKSQKFAPPIGEFDRRAEYYQWMFFSVNSAEKFFSKYFDLKNMTEEYKEEWAEYISDKTLKVMATLDSHLSNKEYVLGEFSAVDTCIGYAIDMVSEESFFRDFSNVMNYFERLKSRPACVEAQIFQRNEK